MMIPTIHMNGTSQEQLMDALSEAVFSVMSAMIALRDTEPNGRDYYPQGATAITHALAEYHARLDRLRSVRAELIGIQEAIAERHQK